jgi:pimeloyl-ACP methyl ester carboxylesterase
MELEIRSHLPTSAGRRTPLLFVHGAFHGAWCWDEYYLPFFASEGWPVHAVSLRGHGASAGSLFQASLEDYATDVRAAIAQIGAPVILIGHSMGGVVSERVWHQSPDKAVGLVFLASSPVRPSLGVVAQAMARYPLSMLRAQMFGDMAAMRRVMQDFFLPPDMPHAERDLHLSRLDLESAKAVRQVFGRRPLKRPDGDTRPVLVVGGREDVSIPLAYHDQLARAYQAPVELCAGAHDLMLDPQWRASAEAIARWLPLNFS